MDEIIILIADLAQNILEKENEYRIGDQFCDFAINAGNDSIRVHKIVIAAASGYFDELLNTNPGLAEIFLEDTSETDLQAIVNYMYTGEVRCRLSEIAKVFILFDQFKIDLVVEECADIISTNLTMENFLDFLYLGEDYNNTKLVESCITYMAKNIEDVLKSDIFVNLSFEEIEALISNDSLSCSENELFESTVRWTLHDIDTRKDFFPALMKHIRVWLINHQYLFDHICRNEMVLNDINCVKKLLDTTKMSLKFENDFNFEASKFSKPRKGFSIEVMVILTETNFLVYSLDDNKPISCTPPLLERKFLGHTNFENNFLITGGDLYNGNTTAICEYYNPILKMWRYIPSMSESRSHHGTVYLKDYKSIYCCGGKDDNSVEICDITQGTWIDGPEMTTAHSDFGIVVDNSCIYAFGGAGTNVVERLDPRMQNWTELPNLEHICDFNRAIKFNDSIYCIGSNRAQVFDIRRNAWEILPDLPFTANYFDLIVRNNKIFLIGGEFLDSETDIWNSFDLESNHTSETSGSRTPPALFYDMSSKTWSTMKQSFPEFISAAVLCSLPEPSYF